jgi:hypothetical protein
MQNRVFWFSKYLLRGLQKLFCKCVSRLCLWMRRFEWNKVGLWDEMLFHLHTSWKTPTGRPEGRALLVHSFTCRHYFSRQTSCYVIGKSRVWCRPNIWATLTQIVVIFVSSSKKMLGWPLSSTPFSFIKCMGSVLKLHWCYIYCWQSDKGTFIYDAMLFTLQVWYSLPVLCY